MSTKDDDDDMWDASVSSLLLNSQKNEAPLSPEEIAWADSFLVQDPDILERDWTSMKDVLLDILGPPSLNSIETTGSYINSNDISIHDVQSLPSNVDKETTQEHLMNENEVIHIDEQDENENIGDGTTKENRNVSPSKDFLKNAFLPGSLDGNLKSEHVDSDFYFDFPEDDQEVSIDDIFKVWNLDIPAEEDELVKELKEATQVVFSKWKSTPSTSIQDTLDTLDTVDTLIAGITDLSLTGKKIRVRYMVRLLIAMLDNFSY